MSVRDETASNAAEQLRSYVALKEEVVRLTRSVHHFLKERGNAEGTERADELMKKLAEDRFNLVVLGQFKRGKSSLINAIVGKELLPTAMIPLTSIVTALKYGPEERAVIRREGFTFPQILPVTQIAEFVTERENPLNEKKVLSAEIEVPVPFLRRGLYFIDTPGVGSMHEHNTATTYAYLPQADAVIFITSPEPPLTETELAFLATIRQHVRKIFFVLNKVDQLTPAEREEALAFTAQVLREHLGADDVHLYPLSARMGLQGQLEQNAEALERSGLPRFQDALARFVAVERSQVFLVATLDRALQLLAEEDATLALEARRKSASPSELASQLATFRARATVLDRTRDSLFRDWSDEVHSWLDEHMAPCLSAFSSAECARLGAVIASAAAERSSLPTPVFQRRLEGWLWDTIHRLFEGWLEEQIHPVFERARQGLVEREAALQRLTQQVEQAAVEAFQLPAPAGTGSADEWTPRAVSEFPRPELPLNASDTRAAVPPLLRLLPRPLAQRWIVRHLQEQLASEFDTVRRAVLATLRVAVERYVLAAEQEWQQAAGVLRQRVEAAVASPSAAGSPSRNGRSAPSSDADALEQRLRDLRAQIEKLRDGLVGANVLPPEPEIRFARPAPPPVASVTRAPAPAQSSRVQQGFRSRSCPVCTSVLKEVHDFFCSWQYQLATREDAQQAYAATHGFCHFHAWRLEEIGSPRGLSSGLPTLAERTAHELRKLSAQDASEWQERVGMLLPRSADCLACQVRDRAEEEYGRFLIRYLSQPEARKEYGRSQGICIPHLRALLVMDPPKEVAEFLLAEQARHLEETAEEMHSYAVKFDTRHPDLLTAGEEDATRRVLVHLLGEKDYR